MFHDAKPAQFRHAVRIIACKKVAALNGAPWRLGPGQLSPIRGQRKIEEGR